MDRTVTELKFDQKNILKNMEFFSKMNISISLVQTKILQFFMKIIILVWKFSHAYNRAYDWVNSEALSKCQNRMNELKDLTSKNRTIYAYRYNFTTVQKNHFSALWKIENSLPDV